MRRAWVVAVAVLVIFQTGIAVAGEGPVTLARREGVGAYLADDTGKALYWFTKDTPGKSACSGGCLDMWPVFFAQSPAGAGLQAGDFTVITREDGKKQTAFRGFPLYYYAGDASPGETNGHKKGGVWFVIDPGAFPPK